MAGTCNIQIEDSKVYKALKKRFGDNETKVYDYHTKVVENEEFTSDFQEWYKQKHNTNKTVTLDNCNAKTIVKDIEEFYYLKTPDGNNSVIDYVVDSANSYTSVADRRFCQRTVANEMLDIFREEHYENHTKDRLSRQDYINAARESMVYRLFDKVLDKLNITEDEFEANITDEMILNRANGYMKLGESKEDAINLANLSARVDYIEERLKDNLNDQEANLLATVKEMLDSTKTKNGLKKSDEFFNQVFRDSRLGKIRSDIGDEFNTEAEDNTQGAEDAVFGELTDEDDTPSNDTYDLSFRVFDSHDGQYKTFMTHVSGDLAMYFNCLRKLRSSNLSKDTPYYNLNNPIGIADTMSANECAMMLYTQGDYNNVDSMIKSIQRIAEQVPGFEAFATFAKDLRNDYDFAYEVYRTFGKMVISKKETYKEGGEFKVRTTNNTASKRQALRFEFVNALRSSSITINYENSLDSYKRILAKLDRIKTGLNTGFMENESTKKLVKYSTSDYLYKKQIAEIKALLVENLRKYLPSVDEAVISNYLTKNRINGKISQVENATTLLSVLHSVITSSNATNINYLSRLADTSEARRYNAKLDAENNDFENPTYHPRSEYKDVASIWSEPFLDKKSEQAAFQLADMLLPYATVKTELNSRNAAGNLSSDVINSSMITGFMNILQNSLNNEDTPNSPINNYAAYKFRSKQYLFSNILVEKIENGVPVNRGLFKLDENGKYVPTPYASELLKMELFNGISDYGSGDSALYATMSKGDYVATGLVNYNKGTATTDGIELTSYMMRVPSDAPKNFIMTAPRYRLDYNAGKNRIIKFWNVEDERALKLRINELINNIAHTDASDIEEIALDNQEWSDDKINLARTLLTGGTISNIKLPNKKGLVTKKDSLEAYLNVNIDGVDFIIRGTLNDNKDVLTGAKLYTVVTNGTPSVVWGSKIHKALEDHYRTNLIKGKLRMADGSVIKRRVNREHPIFRQMYYAFKQEMQDAATAVDRLFTHTNGRILINTDGNPEYSSTLKSYNNPERATYANYHRKDSEYEDEQGNKHKEKGIVQNLWQDKTKTTLKRLSGNVFTSDKFTIFDEEGGITRNFMQEVLAEDIGETEDGKIRILYGGANTHLHIDADGNVKFTPAQEELIQNKLEEFMLAYIEDVNSRISNYENLFDGIDSSYDNVAEFALNYRLAYFNCNDLFEGDTKFYKNSQDFLKRSKETQGSGVPYAIVDWTTQRFNDVNVPVKNAFLNQQSTQDWLKNADKNHVLGDCRQFTTFRAVTITNTIRTSAESQGILVDKLTSNFVKDGLSYEDARKKAQAMMDGYKNTKVDDAQSYITFEEWIRRIAARGQFHKYQNLIEAILDESKPLSNDIIDEFIQVQKNFYYDMHYNDVTGTMAPRQIKNAEFVLVPRLVRGTELEQVYNAMKHYGIDQLNTEETSKAGKANVLTLWDKDGNLTKEWTDDFNTNVQSAIEIFDYNYLYTQQETPQHMNAENKAGIQIMKKIIDNIDEFDSNGKPNPLWNVKQRFMRNYSENIYDSFVTLIKDLKLQLDENGNVKINQNGNSQEGTISGLDYKIFLDRVKDEMMRLGLDSNMLDMVTLNENPAEDAVGQNNIGLDTKVPPYFNSNRKKFESVAQAVFNNFITRQKLPGFHAAQITNVGFKSLGTKFSDKVEKVSYNRNLIYHPNGEPYIEVMLPASNFGFDRNDSRYDNIREQGAKEGWTNAEIEAKIDDAMLAELKAKSLDTIIGYRIPTEGKQSVCVMKVAGFVSDAYGSTIVVPDDWVAQTGSDFDIDSVYGIQFATYKDANGIQKVKYSEDVNQNYINYVLRNLSKEDRKKVYDSAKLDKEARKEVLEESKDDNYIDYLNNKDVKAKERLLFYAKQAASENGLESFDEFSTRDIATQNTRNARNNQILEDMITILQSEEALEENLSQSQFKKITDARDAAMSDEDKARRAGRSPFDFLDQADYQEDAMSGAKLKARSVVLDTLCSVANTTKPILTKGIDITYKADAKKEAELVKRFGKDNVRRLNNSYVIVTHKMYGHSNDNKNVVGSILTAYSSQTTAHILDAIKEGAIQNVNDLTFGVYKLFPNIGSDYETGVAFMMQPGVSEIVNAYNRNKSIYAKDYENPVDQAKRKIAKKLNIADDKTTLSKIDDKIKELLKSSKIFGGKSTEDINATVLNSELLVARIKGNTDYFSSPVEELLFDYMVVKQYDSLSSIAGKIDAYTRVLNPDKFGAKQTIFATNEVFDNIADILLDDTPVFAHINNKPFIESVYPGIGRILNEGIDGYIKHEDNNSSYRPLHYFLKYASATSIKVNRTLFLTQKPNFVNAVKRLSEVLSDNSRLKEETYNKFEKYILNDIYKDVDIISRPVSYEYGKGIVETNGDKGEEQRRIFGYGYTPDLKITTIGVNEDGSTFEERKEFNPVDINHPTEKELDEFAKFTPAQKVYWIQQHFNDGLVCKYIKTNLANSNEYRKAKAGSQTIEFVEEGQDKEMIYDEFRKTYQNNNPLLVMTAMDIIKYAFVVEGYDMKKGAVNKVISNEILTTNRGLFGTGIIASLNDKVTMFADTVPDYRMERLMRDFVRSHSTMKEISHTWLNKKDKGKYTKENSYGVVAIALTEENESFVQSHNLGRYVNTPVGREFITNKYIEIKYSQTDSTLYEIQYRYNANTLYLIPLNKLQEYESGEWSANDSNNKYNNYNFYTSLLDEYEASFPNYDAKIIHQMAVKKYNENKAAYSKPAYAKEEIKESVDFDINDKNRGATVELKDVIKKHFDGFNGSPLFLENATLADHIYTPGPEHGLIKAVDGKLYNIYKLSTKHLFQYTNEKGLSKPIRNEDSAFTELINRARQRGIAAGHPGMAHLNNVYAVIPYNSSTKVNTQRSSTRVDSMTRDISRADKAIRRKARNEADPDAERYVAQVERSNIEATTKSVNEKLSDVAISSAEYVVSAVDNLLNGNQSLNFFVQDPETGSYLAINNPKVMAMAREDPKLRRNFLQKLLEAQHLISTFESFATFNYNDDNANLKYYIDKINAAVAQLTNSPILKEAEELYVTDYLAKISNNPNIRRNIVSLLDGYHSTSWLTAQLNDLQETSNPVIQIITSTVMADIRAKELQGVERVREFQNFMSDIKAEAARNGHTINFKNIIDEYGRFINDYNETFINDLESHRTATDEAYKAYKDAATPVEKSNLFEKYLQAKLAYDKWKLANTNQELSDDYYRRKIELEESLINTDTNRFEEIYVEYKMLNDMLRDVLSHNNQDGLDPNWEAQRVDILNKIKELKADAIKLPNGQWAAKRDYEDYELAAPGTEARRKQNLLSLTAANRLSEFTDKLNALNDEYYDKTERFGFKEQLDKYLPIIEFREKVDPVSGRPIYTETELAQDEIYQKAKDWVSKNAYYQYSFYKNGGKQLSIKEQEAILSEIYDKSVVDNYDEAVQAALNYFRHSVGSRNNRSAVYKTIANALEARDRDGIIDARKFTVDDIAAIKKEQEARFGIGESVQFNERSIIKNATSDDIIYTDAFYKGMQVDGLTNPAYLQIVKDLNEVLRYGLDSSTGQLHTSDLTYEQLQQVLEQFKKLGYDSYEQTFNARDGVKKHKGVTKAQAKQVQKFIEENVEFALSDEDKRRFDIEKRKAEDKGRTDKRYYLAWLEVNQEWDEKTQTFVPNHLLWGYARPKSTLSQEQKDKFISKQKTAAVRILREVFTEKPTKYYEMEYNAKANEFGVDSPEFKAWYEANHIYNPHSRKYEPITCWLQSTPNSNMPGEWRPSYKMTSKTAKTGKGNDKFKRGLGVAANYKSNSTNSYARQNNANAEEIKVKEHLQALLAGLARTKAAKCYIEQGYLPTRSVDETEYDAKFWLKELAKGFGYVESTAGYERWDTNIGYDYDYVPEMPMLQQLQNKDTHRAPYREMFEDTLKGEEEFKKAKEEYEKNKEQYAKENREIHKKLIDQDWESVIEEFITKTAHYNAIQDNKYQLYFGQKLINDLRVYQTRMSAAGKLKKDSTLSSDDETVYQTAVDNNLQDQYTNWIRRVIFDQYKKPQGKRTKIFQILQGITSTNYMTLNIRGGIANITVGEANIWGEAFAREYFGKMDWLVGKRLYLQGISSYAAHMYDETSSSVVDAIIKGMNIVDYDEVTGRVTQKSLAEWSKRLRDAAFAPQTMGEHLMQNSAMLSMMVSHRIIPNPKKGEPGESDYAIMNKAEFMTGSMDEALKEICTDSEYKQYLDYVDSIRNDANKAKDFAWFRADTITKFVMTRLSKDQQNAYIKAEETARKRMKSEFEQHPTLFSQFKLGKDKKMDFVEGSILDTLRKPKEGQEVSDAYKLLGQFKGRVISVNKKIHGNYGKLDAAKIESEWWGGLAMQYHKHIVPGFMKRWRRQGYFNEERGTVEKGSYVALYDFLTSPIKAIAERNAWSEGQTETMTGIQNIFSYVTDYLHYAKLAWNIMPEYERANIRRNLGDVAGMLIAVMGAILLRCGYDDDDESIAYNLGLYEMDRLATECFMWNPLGLYAEGKKLWSSPIAAQSIIGDCINIMGTAAGILFEGEDYDLYFHSGRYAGRHKLGVYIERRLPYWRNWVALRDIADNNHYYKMGDNILSFINVKDIANSIKGKK